jgi:hypothetical protein
MRTDHAIAFGSALIVSYIVKDILLVSCGNEVHDRYLAVFDVCIRAFTHDGDDFRSGGAGGVEKGF